MLVSLYSAFAEQRQPQLLCLLVFVNSGLMTLPQSMGVIIYAYIGTTITVQLACLQDIADYAILFGLIGITTDVFIKECDLKKY